jgi:hypothetical protein
LQLRLNGQEPAPALSSHQSQKKLPRHAARKKLNLIAAI